MRTLPKILSILGVFVLSLSCQRDDICPAATDTTLPLTVSFFDYSTPDNPKPPVNLSIKATSVDTIYDKVFNSAEIKIPLRTDIDVTTYVFRLNTPASNDTIDNSNRDTIVFSYGRKEVYINRACSYKVEFTGLTAHLVTANDDNLWIKRIKVNNENDTIPHISVFH